MKNLPDGVLDNFDRLDAQLKEYFKAFNRVCVVTSENYFDKLSDMLCDTPVGICVVTKRDTISAFLMKDTFENNMLLEHRAIFKVLHKTEYESIIENHFGKLPCSSQVFYYDECFLMFKEIPLLEAYSMALKQLKKRNKIVKSKFREVPYELKSIMYFLRPSQNDFDGLNRFLGKTYRGVALCIFHIFGVGKMNCWLYAT